MKKNVIFLLSIFAFSINTKAQFISEIDAFEIIQLESKKASPDLQKWKGGERLLMLNGDRNTATISNVSSPSLIAFLPKPENATGTAMIIAPGGAFHLLAINHEGYDVAKWCVEKGIAAFVLKYRLVPTGENPGKEFMEKFQKGQEQMDKEMAPYIDLAKADALAAIEHVRKNAAKYQIKTDKIGIIGFSAGGTLAGSSGLEYNSEINRPDFIAPIYGALHVLNLKKLPENPMPLFMAVSGDDSFGFQKQSLEIYETWNQAKLPVELHLYQEGGHGFGMKIQNLPSDKWIETFDFWLKSNGF